MRVMVMIEGDGVDEDKIAPTEEMFAAMGAYNEQLVNAGIMLDGDGLKPSVRRRPDRVRVAARPPSSTGRSPRRRRSSRGTGSGRSKSLEEAVEWAKRCPTDRTPTVVSCWRSGRSTRSADFGGEFTPELQEQEDKLRERIARAARLEMERRGDRPGPYRRGRLADGVGPVDRQPDPDRAGRRDRRGDRRRTRSSRRWSSGRRAGVPPNPGAWLMATAKHKAIDRIRREVARDEKYAVIARDLETDRRRTRWSRCPTTCSRSSSPRAIRCCRGNRGWR